MLQFIERVGGEPGGRHGGRHGDRHGGGRGGQHGGRRGGRHGGRDRGEQGGRHVILQFGGRVGHGVWLIGPKHFQPEAYHLACASLN